MAPATLCLSKRERNLPRSRHHGRQGSGPVRAAGSVLYRAAGSADQYPFRVGVGGRNWKPALWRGAEAACGDSDPGLRAGVGYHLDIEKSACDAVRAPWTLRGQADPADRGHRRAFGPDRRRSQKPSCRIGGAGTCLCGCTHGAGEDSRVLRRRGASDKERDQGLFGVGLSGQTIHGGLPVQESQDHECG